MKNEFNRIISMLLCVCMLLGVMPVSAFASESTGNTLDSGMDDPTIGSSGQEPEETGDAPIHWLQQYQAAALAQMQRPATYAMQRASGGSPSYSMIEWSGGQLQFANGAYLGSPMPQIYFNGGTAFCAEWNGEHPAGSYSNAGEGSDSTIKQILANYEASGGSDADYAAAQAAIWAHLMGTSVSSWGGCPGSSAYSEMVNGDADYSGLTYTLWGGGTQKILTYEIAEDPDLPEQPEEPEEPPTEEEYPPDEYEIIVETETETETEVRNRKSYTYSDAIGQITIRKHDQNGDSLDDALFDIDVAFSDGSHHRVENWEVDNGARLFTWTHPQDNHDPATVTITEVQAPNGYSMDPTPKTATVAPTYTRVTHVETWTVTIVTETTSSTVIEIASGEVVAESASSSTAETESEPQVEEFADFIEGDREITVTFVNTEMPCSLTIYKHETGNKNIALEGATFRIRYADPSVSAQTWTMTTDANGEIHIALPAEGALIVEELFAPEGYVMTSKTTYDVTVMKGESKVIEIPNDKKTQLIVIKKDAQTGELLAGASIRATLLRSNTEPFESGQTYTETTGADGRAVFSNLIPGEYRVEEISPPQYYQGTSVVHTVNILEGNSETVTVQFENEPWTGLTIKKVDATNAKGLPGAIFKLYKGSEEDPKAYLGDWESGANGSVTIQNLEPGYYTVVEHQAPDGYLLDEENRVQTIEIKSNAVDENITIVFQNNPKPKLLIEKIDADTGAKLAGAVFHIARRDSAEYLEVTTGRDGTVLVEDLEHDWYTVTEITAPEGYLLDSAHRDVELIPGKTTTLVIDNFKQPGLRIEKIDADTGAKLAGAVFHIARRGSEEYIEVTTGADGTVFVEDLEHDWYTVTEVKSPTGYILDSTHHDVEFVPGKVTSLVISNSKQPGVLIEKIDADTGAKLAGAVFHIARRDSEEYIEVTTGSDGTVLVDGLTADWYTVTEVKAPTGYILDSTHHDVEFVPGKVTSLVIKNSKQPGVLIEKIDADTGAKLAGAVFHIARRDSDEYIEVTTGSDGTILVDGLVADWYTVTEVKAPEGYLLDSTHHDVEFVPGKVTSLVIKNSKQPGVLIEKIDADTGAKLAGAVFHVARRDSDEYIEVTTGADGTVLVDGLAADWYTVTEVKAPDGYILDSTHYDVEFIPGEVTSLVIQNHQQPDLTIRKVDEQTGKGLPGAVLRVTKDGAREYRDVTTGADGVVVVKDLEAGWYIVEERNAPDGYLLDSTPHYIELIEGEDTELVIKNRHKPSLEILKTDSVTGQPLAGVLFEVKIKNGKTLGEYSTDAAGRIYLEDIDPELYVITEIEAPDGYIMETGSKEALVEWGKVVTVEFKNQPRNPILIHKVDTKTGEPLEGAKFMIQEVNGAFVAEMETGRNGYITVTGIDPGFYTVKEVKAPLGYILDETPKTVELKADEPAVVEFENQPLNGLHIKKIDSETQAPLEGAKFRVSEKNGRLIGEFTTDNQGEIIIDDLQPGWFSIEEIAAPDGYRLDNTPKDVEFVWGEFVTVEFTNELLSPILIKKVDAETGAPLAGALFKVTKADGQFVGEFTTGTDGFLNVPELEPGFYIVSELRAPEGYQLDQTPVTVEVKASVPTLVEFVNNRLPGLQVQKIDAETKEPLSGAKFRVERSNGERVGDFVTNSAGFFVVTDLEADTYVVYETAAPAGYILDTTPQNVVLKPNETATLEYSNKPLAGLQIKKVDDVTGEPLAGVEFTITELDGAMVGSYVTDDAGLIFVPDLLEGWYVVTETRPLEGYKPDTAPRNVEVLSGKLNVVEYRNQPYPHLQILKVDSETKQPLEGVKFALSDHMGRGLGSFTTNAQGMIHLTGMDAGVYFVQEVEAVPGYVLDSTAREIELLWGKTTKLEIPNTPMGTLLLKKVDSETGQPLYGATFILYDSKNNIIGEYTTDNNGMIEFPRSLAEGKYKIKEIKAPEGYVLDDMPKTIEIKSGETLELEIPNEPMRGQIQIVKKSADDNPITKEKAGTLLEGATFEIYNERLEVVDTITTDSRGQAITKELPMGTYGIKEITAPEYYLTDGSVFYATLKIDGDLVRFEVLNKSIEVEVTVEKSGNMEVLAGDIMSYDFSNIRNNSNVALDEFYWHDQLPDEVRIGKIVTGTWSERLTYAITYRTNKNEKYQVLEDGLSSEVSHTLDCGGETLGLAEGEYVTDIRFEFGTVQPGFSEVEKPVFYVTTLANLADGYRIINRTDVGGKIGDEWVMGKDTWITVVLAQERGDLPKTGV